MSSVYADAVVDRDPELVVDDTVEVGARMAGQPPGEEVRPVVAAMADEEERVVLRCRPYATFAYPPRHLHPGDRAEIIMHWVSVTLPWDEADPAK